MISQIFSGFSPGFFPRFFFPDFFPDYSHRNKIRFYWTMKTKNRNQGFCVRLRVESVGKHFVLNRGLTVYYFNDFNSQHCTFGMKKKLLFHDD